MKRCLTLQRMTYIGLLGVLYLSLFVCTYVLGTAFTWTNGHPFPPFAKGTAFFSIIVCFTGAWLFLHVYSASEGPRSPNSAKRLHGKVPSWVYALLVVLITFRVTPFFSMSNDVTYHPIDMLMYNAKSQHEEWLKRASASSTLAQATEEYRRRYNRHPPP